MTKCEICKKLANGIYELLKKKADNKQIKQEDLEILKLLEANSSFQPCMECDNGIDYLFSRDELIKFVNGEINIKVLQQDIQYWELAIAHDRVLSSDREYNKGFIFNKLDVKEDVISIYLDFNMISYYEDKEEIELNHIINNSINSGKFIFLCSPVHLEELNRIDGAENRSKRMDSIRKICNDKGIVCIDDKLTYCERFLDQWFDKVVHCSELFEAQEQLKLVHKKDVDVFFRERFKKDYKNIVNNLTIGQMDQLKLEEMDKLKLKEIDEIETSQLKNQIMDSLLYWFTCEHTLEEIKEAKEEKSSFGFLYDSITNICRALDVLGFYSDKKERVVRSGLYDAEHLVYASKCNYFVTDDKKLFKRATEIFKFMGIDTKVINKQEILDMLCSKA